MWLPTQPASAAPEDAAVRPACVAEDTCTLVQRLSVKDGVETVALLDHSTPRAAPNQAFAQWLSWSHPPAAARARVWRGGSVRIERPTEAGTFLLRTVPGVRLAEEPDGLLVLITFDPLRPGTPAELPEPIAIARERGLLSPEQETRAAREAQAQRARTQSLVDAWTVFSRAPGNRAARAKLVDVIGGEGASLDADSFLTPEQRTALRRAGLALEGRILLEDGPGPGIAYRLRVEAVPLEQVAREWNAGLRALVNPLERVPRPLLLVAPASRHEEVSFTLDVKDGDEGRMSQLVRRLLAVPGLSTDGKELPPPGL
ncbi:MAG: hypothetical protein ACLPJH_14035 [Myxococcaceae bacterium]